MIDTVIFDFDGVIADSGAIFAETLEEILGREPFTDAEIKEMRHSTPLGMMKMLGIKKWQVPRIAAKGKKA
ncbi:MAG TPA: HAD hydrolase-like protein [Candidatus Saccharimonadales bacterium]